MTPEAQQVAIEKAVGDKWWVAKYPGDLLRRPDYLNDLNAMHEAEKMLTKEHWHDYWKHLENYDANPYCVCFAPAAQRAEAFLRTLGLWKDDT